MNILPTLMNVSMYSIVFLYGITIGSFLNVVICRVPRGESVVKVRSHCEDCGYQLKWYDLIPVFSYIFLRGKCRKCKAVISIQHPLIEGLNGVLYIMLFARFGLSVETLLFCLMGSALIALSVIDFRTYEIPSGFPYFIFALGVVRVITQWPNWQPYVIGFFAVSTFLFILLLASGGRAMGGGDVRLMAACGLVTGWQQSVLALVIGCILGGVIHLIRMKVSGEEHMLAMGPYLAAGVMIAVMWGDYFIAWYLGLLGL